MYCKINDLTASSSINYLNEQLHKYQSNEAQKHKWPNRFNILEKTQ